MIFALLSLLGLAAGFGGLAWGYFVLGPRERTAERWSRLTRGWATAADEIRRFRELHPKTDAQRLQEWRDRLTVATWRGIDTSGHDADRVPDWI